MKRLMFIIMFVLCVSDVAHAQAMDRLTRIMWCPVTHTIGGERVTGIVSYRLYTTTESHMYIFGPIANTTALTIPFSDLSSLPTGTHYFSATAVDMNDTTTESAFSNEIWAIKNADGSWTGYHSPIGPCPPSNLK